MITPTETATYFFYKLDIEVKFEIRIQLYKTNSMFINQNAEF